MRRWRPLVLATGFCGLVGWGASAQTLTEEQALTRMRMEHPQIRVLRFTVHELAAAARERSLLANPTVSYTREDAGLSADDFLLVTQELPVRRRLGLLGEAGEQAVNAAEARADADLLAFDTRLRLAFTDLLLAQERTQALETGVSELSRLVDVLRAREEQGEVPGSTDCEPSVRSPRSVPTWTPLPSTAGRLRHGSPPSLRQGRIRLD